LLEDVLSRTETDAEGIRALYGPALGPYSQPTRAWTDGSCIGNGSAEARAGAGVFFGVNSRLNDCARVFGRQTNNRGEHLSIILALLAVHPATPLTIYSDSELVIRTYCYWARKMEQDGWHCANSDLIQYTVHLLRTRRAPVSFRWVKGHSGNDGNDAADALAKAGAS
ncbi:ribonuclease H-like domain-containing protein, partial [Schizophyllum commune]